MATLSEHDRDQAVRDLTRHCGDGRLTLDELEERIGEVYTATSAAELRHALRELPRFRPPPRTPSTAPDRPARRTRAAAARQRGLGMVGGASSVLVTLTALLLATGHVFLAVVLLVVWLPRCGGRRALARA